MAQSPVVKRVWDIIKQPVESLNLKVWDVRFLKEGASWYLRVFIDKDGGVSINDCTDVSRLIDPLLDQYDPIDRSYYLEVCSPGLCRELVLPEHFSQMLGSEVLVRLIRPRDNVREFVGILKAYDGSVTVEINGTETVFDKKEIAFVKLNETF
ncbi:MAG: ribosome maturation factor RimP [bacterium]|nr:ribosome maturation factor RimP [bacterium]